MLSDGTKSVNSSFALIVITGLLRVDGTEEDCKAVAAGLNGVSHGTKSVTMIACYDYDWMGGGDWALQTDEDEDVNVLNAVLNKRANSELTRVTLDADGWGAFGNSTATSKAGGMSAGAVVGVLFAIIAVVGVGAAAFKFRHKLVTMGRKDGGATEPGLAVTMNTQYEPNLTDAAGILNAIADRNTTAIAAPYGNTTGNGNGNDGGDDDDEALPPNPASAATSNTNNPFFASAVDDTQC